MLIGGGCWYRRPGEGRSSPCNSSRWLCSLRALALVGAREFIAQQFGLRLPERVDIDQLAVHRLAVLTKWRCGELQHQLAAESLPEGVPGGCFRVLRLVDEQVRAQRGHARLNAGLAKPHRIRLVFTGPTFAQTNPLGLAFD